MLAKIVPPTNDFLALARYLVDGKERPPNPKRVAWTFTRNLPTDDPELAAIIMAATAETSRRCKNAVYHTMIAWHPDERPSPDLMQEIAAKTLDLAGLADHQALVMGHSDKDHAHLHMLINRVHPSTGKAWSTSHDYRRFDQIMKQLSEEYGFHYAPAHAFNPDLTDDLAKGPKSSAAYAATRGANTNRPQWSRSASRQLGKLLSEDFDRATSWDDIEDRLAEQNLTLKAKGKGLVVGNAASYAKFSALCLNVTANGLAKRFGEPFAKHRPNTKRQWHHPWWEVDAIDVAKAIGSKDDVREAINDISRQRKARRSKLPLMQQLMAELTEQLKSETSLKPPRSKRQKAHHGTRPQKSRGYKPVRCDR